MSNESVMGSSLGGDRVFPPSPEFVSQANAADAAIYESAAADPEAYWAEWAKKLDWIEPWTEVCQWNPPHAKWFVGGKLNVSANCIDRHLKTARRNKAAIIFEGEPGDTRVLTYHDLWREVNAFAGVLKNLGVAKGDRVSIYLPMIPEAAIAMLACTRIGAIHTVIFGGFSSESLRERINDSQSKVVVTSSGGWRRGNVVRLKETTDAALAGDACPLVESVVVLNRAMDPSQVPMTEGRDHWWHRLVEEAPRVTEPEVMDSEDGLFILYTSGSTGKPKGIYHTSGGYLTQANATFQWTFDIKETDVFWCTADVGWVTGHSYVVYGPLAAGATVLMYEGAPDWPARDRFWATIEKYGVSVFYTAPTAIRTFMKWGTEHLEKYDLSSLRLLGSVGEPINPEAWLWYHEHVGHGNCPVVDTWWQTETGAHMITALPGIVAGKPGSATRPFPGITLAIVDEEGNPAPTGKDGLLVIQKPWPSMLRTLWGDDERYQKVYWSKFGDKNLYFAGDGARQDEDGYFWLLGRVDDVMLVAGHNISTMEIESALVSHPAVAESAVIGKTHEIKGQAIAAFVSLKEGIVASQELQDELKKHVGQKLGPICRPDDILFTAELPKTRSGKIMRRLLRDIAEGRAMGDTSTLADPSVVSGLKDKYENSEG
ncbi:MAG: acetate--CoA ligase [Armatimonadetes bacterium]|nr:acetate--CoA ligase [Armatimonadota bacterium]